MRVNLVHHPEPSFQPIEGEIVIGIPGDNARPDVRARGAWRDGQNAFFNVWITNSNSASQHNAKTEKRSENIIGELWTQSMVPLLH